MNSVYVLDKSFNLLGVIDEYVSIIWRPSFSEIGDFEIYLGATDKAIQLLQENYYVVRSNDISVDTEGNTTYKKVMIIKNIQLVTDVENGDFLTVTGRELKYLLHQRIIWTQTNLYGNTEDGIRKLVTENAISPKDNKRAIPNLVLGDKYSAELKTLTAGTVTINLTDTIEKQITGDYLDQAIVDICTVYNYGWDIHIFNNQLVFSVYAGVDRSYNQTAHPYVVFSDDFENLYNTDYQLSTEGFANTSLIGGEGEGLDRIYTTIGNENTGLDRFETFSDVRDVSQNKGNEDEIPLATYLNLLAERGRENLASLAYTEGFSGELLSDVAFKYGEDFNLGDIVSVINKYGISRNVRVLSAIESEDESGTKLVPQFNI